MSTIKMSRDELRQRIAELQGWSGFRQEPYIKGWPPNLFGYKTNDGGVVEYRPVPDPATDIAAAMVLFDEMPVWDLRRLATHYAALMWRVSWTIPPHVTVYGQCAPTKELAICLAWYQWKTGDRIELEDV
jgi:hypothetical protein